MKNIVAKEYLAYTEAFSGVMSPKEVPAYFSSEKNFVI